MVHADKHAAGWCTLPVHNLRAVDLFQSPATVEVLVEQYKVLRKCRRAATCGLAAFACCWLVPWVITRGDSVAAQGQEPITPHEPGGLRQRVLPEQQFGGENAQGVTPNTHITSCRNHGAPQFVRTETVAAPPGCRPSRCTTPCRTGLSPQARAQSLFQSRTCEGVHAEPPWAGVKEAALARR